MIDDRWIDDKGPGELLLREISSAQAWRTRRVVHHHSTFPLRRHLHFNTPQTLHILAHAKLHRFGAERNGKSGSGANVEPIVSKFNFWFKRSESTYMVEFGSDIDEWLCSQHAEKNRRFM